MKGNHQITYAVDFRSGHRRVGETVESHPLAANAADRSIPRIARLMALALRFDGLLREGTIRDYAELARLGRVTRARVTQIMRLLDLAPDLQEQILFLQNTRVLNERNLRSVARELDWDRQRALWPKIIGRFRRASHKAS